jgi:hypothetical protein
MAAGLLIGTAANLPASILTFSGATAFGADSTGAENGAGVTSTGICCQLINVEEGTFTGDPANYITTPINLTDGSYTFYLESSPDWTASFGVTNGGVNLFFDDSTTPGISASTVPTFDQTVFNPFVVTANTEETMALDDSEVLASGTLSYVSPSSGQTVTLTSLQWVGGSGSNPYDPSSTVQQVDIAVSGGTPEPGTLLLLGAGLGLLGVIRRKSLRG